MPAWPRGPFHQPGASPDLLRSGTDPYQIDSPQAATSDSWRMSLQQGAVCSVQVMKCVSLHGCVPHTQGRWPASPRPCGVWRVAGPMVQYHHLRMPDNTVTNRGPAVCPWGPPSPPDPLLSAAHRPPNTNRSNAAPVFNW